MFGMGGSEILVILVVALLFLGPEKLPEAASKLSKGIRDLKKQTRELTQTIENDTQIGGAIRDLKSALRGEEPRPQAKITPKPARKPSIKSQAKLSSVPAPETPAIAAAVAAADTVAAEPAADAATEADAAPEPAPAPAPKVRLPDTAGEAAELSEPAASAEDDDAELAKLIRAPADTVAKGDAG